MSGPPGQLFALLHAAGVVESHLESKLSTVGLSLAKIAALQQLIEAGESLPLGQLAGRLACVKSNVTQLVDRLEADGLVARAPDPRDRRSRLAVVTDAGRAAYKRGVKIRDKAEKEVFDALSPADAAHLLRLTRKLDPVAKTLRPGNRRQTA